jgi:ubiquinone/menaquinone biosynthesis C-methylase UbiE
VEHLAPAELDATLREALRVLKPAGRLVVHTAPNRLVYDVTYRVLRALHPRGRRTWAADPRHPLEHVQHVNEQSPGSLRRALKRSGFERVGVRMGSRVGRRSMRRGRARHLARVPLVRLLVVLDIWAEGSKPTAS